MDSNIEIPDTPNNEAVLKEYSATRDEILQANSQVFAILTSGLGLDIIIVGWIFASKQLFQDFWYLPLFGIVILFLTNLVLLSKSRGAHRLALFQKYFIEERIPDICWARVYFAYRKEYPLGISEKVFERIGEGSAFVVLIVQALNLLLMVILIPLKFPDLPCYSIICIIAISILWIILQWIIVRSMTNYKKVDQAFKEVLNKRVKKVQPKKSNNKT
jgi:hypothetical protein